jgi:mRNA interferase MazF
MVKGHTPTFRRGDVVLVAFPLISDFSQSKVRPAVVVQNDVGNRFSPNLIVVAISSRLPKRAYPTNFIVRLNTPEAQGTGLDRDSVVHADIILTVPKSQVIKVLGRFSDTAMQAIDQCLRVSLDLT